METYKLQELQEISCDSWCFALSEMFGYEWVRKEAYAGKGWEYPEDDSNLLVSEELENQLMFIATRDKFRFDKFGNIESYERW